MASILRLANAFLLLQLIFVCINPLNVYANCPPPVKPPTLPPTSPPSSPPVKPPTSPPTLPPVKPPTSPPTSPPVKPPTSPPVKPPTSPPTSPPVKPPTSPPVKPPTSPPTSPPVKPPTSPPVKPPTSPPTSPPVKPPTSPPVKPPTSPPTSPPVQPPTSPPVQPPMSPQVYPAPTKGIAVQGVVFCRSVCTLKDKYNQITRTALEGAVVKIVCIGSSKKNSFERKVTTDGSGNFLLTTSRVKGDGVKNCRVFLVRSRSRECNVPTTLNAGPAGAPLTPTASDPNNKKLEGYSVHNVGPLAFEPAKIRPCYY